MSSPDSTSNNLDPNQAEGVGNDGLDVTSNYAHSHTLEATGAYDSRTRPQATDLTSAFDSDGTPQSSGGSIHDRMRSASPAALIGTVIGGYKIVAPLGQGGMGRVFRADDSSGRPVAIKLLSPDLARSSEALARFKQEGLIASQINHSRCVFVHRVDEESGTPFIAMELMTGLTLKDLVIQKGPLPYAEAIKLILQCIEGLIEAHSRGMIHRDIKPANCYLDARENVKIGDFGLARSLVSDSELTQTGAFIGTPLFASPEQLLGQNIDVRSDIYSLTATLYFLLAGKAPFESPHAAQVIARIASSDPPPFKTVEVSVPEELERIVMKGLARDATKRYQSFAEMQVDLLALMAPKPETATLPRRAIAALADSFLLSMVVGLLTLTLIPKSLIEESKLFASLLSAAISFSYFFIAEFIFATSLGKAALRIRVADSITGRRAGILKILRRSASFVLISLSIDALVYTTLYATGWIRTDVIAGLLLASSGPIGYLLLLSTWRYTGKRQLLHDWLSSTECLISAPPVVQSTQLDLPDYAPAAVTNGAPIPALLGRFRINNQINVPSLDSSVRWLAGDDPQLERCVWVALSQDPEIDYEQQQCAKDPSTRLRFIEQGIEGNLRWFAYVAPEGIPLRECLSRGVHFAWPVTSFVFRQMLNHFHSVTNSSYQATIARLSDWWIDRAGRVSIVSLDSALQAVQSGTPVEQIKQQNAVTYRELLQTVSLLALPQNHHLRKKFCQSKPGLFSKCLLAREALPPLRSIRFCESVAANKFLPTIPVLELELVNLNRGNHVVSSKTRFFNAILSTAFCVPILAFIGIMMIMPSVIHFVEVRSNTKLISTLTEVATDPESDDAWWKGASNQQREYWTSAEGQQKLQDLNTEFRDKLERVYAGIGKVERAFLKSLPIEEDPIKPSNFRLEGKSNDESVDGKDFNMEMVGGRISFNEGANSKWRADEMKSALAIAEQNSVDIPRKDGDVELVMGRFALGLLVGLSIWTWLTFGGLSTRLSGICIVSRDGGRMGFIKSAWRSIVIFALPIVLVLIVSNWPLVTLGDLWWTTQIKRVLMILPLAYLASTLIWNNRTIADVLSGTTAIPR